MMRPNVARASGELCAAFARAQTEDDLRFVLDIAGDVRREMGDGGPSVEQRLQGAMARLARIARRAP